MVSSCEKQFQVIANSGAKIQGQVVYVVKKLDFALVKIENSNYTKTLQICYVKYPIPVKTIFALGSLLGLGGTFARG